jgi:hypothetical protein
MGSSGEIQIKEEPIMNNANNKLDLELSIKDRSTVLNYCELITAEKDFRKKNEYADKLVKLIATIAVEDYKLSVTSY